jgi:hypothetical protein
MKMLYQVQMMAPRLDMQQCPVQVNLWPEWKDAVARYDINQEKANRVIESLHRPWLDGCGWNRMYDPDNAGCYRDETMPLGPNARKVYGPHDIRITWGEWGPEHITVPGNACGLDLSHSIGSAPRGMSLLPHNVDTMRQAYLLLVIFTWFGDAIICNELCLEHDKAKSSNIPS